MCDIADLEGEDDDEDFGSPGLHPAGRRMLLCIMLCAYASLRLVRSVIFLQLYPAERMDFPCRSGPMEM